MCGLVSVISKNQNGFDNKSRDIFHELLYIDTLRGDDATGTFLVDGDGNLDLAKEANEASYFQRSPEYLNLMAKAFREGTALVGHNRKATRGVISDENAHPFVVDDRYVLVHNGTLFGDHKKIADVEVDSHAITHLIHQKEGDAEAALRELTGAYALIWYDVQKRELNFVRNDQRPLYFIETPTSWVWASEVGMLGWIIGRNQGSTIGQYTMLPAGELHTFTRKGRSWDRSVRKLDLTKKSVYNSSNDTPWAGFDGDSCSLPSDRRSSIDDGWEDVDDASFAGHMGASRIPATPPTRTVMSGPFPVPLVARGTSTAALDAEATLAKFTLKVLPGESERAWKKGCIMNVDRFQTLSTKYSNSEWVTGRLFDYDYARGDSVTQGIFLYAVSVDDADLMIRVYVPYDPTDDKFEEHTLQLVIAENKCAFKIRTKGWHRHASGDVTEGFACLYADNYSEITAAANVVSINGD